MSLIRECSEHRLKRILWRWWHLVAVIAGWSAGCTRLEPLQITFQLSGNPFDPTDVSHGKLRANHRENIIIDGAGANACYPPTQSLEPTSFADGINLWTGWWQRASVRSPILMTPGFAQRRRHTGPGNGRYRSNHGQGNREGQPD